MKKILKWLGIGFVALIIIGLIGSANSPSTPPGDSQNASETASDTETQQTSERTPEESLNVNIEVTSQIVKKVDSKYRYFFDIRNQGEESFEGSVTIELVTQQGLRVGKETFDTKSPIEPSLGSPVFFDINTAPVAIHGENGVDTFRFSVLVNGKEVATGEGDISEKLEDLSGF